MVYSYHGKKLDSYFGLSTNYPLEKLDPEHRDDLLRIIWNKGVEPIDITIDGVPAQIEPNQIITTTFLHKVYFPRQSCSLICFAFNREFYCIQDHDHEVSCNGIIFFGSHKAPIVTLDEVEAGKYDLLYKVFLDEFKTQDKVQGEMLQMLLKRLIIKTTRLAKSLNFDKEIPKHQIDIIRKYNVLVDLNFKSMRKVSDYAEMLNKSPKTLSNIFSKYEQKPPLSFIQERIILEAKRLLIYTDKSAKEISFDLGFRDVSAFHKMFKKVSGMTTQQFKERSLVENFE